MTDEEIDKIIFDTVDETCGIGLKEMRSLVLAGMAVEREKHRWRCPQCGGHHFGRDVLSVDPTRLGDFICHDEFKVGCKWMGPRSVKSTTP